MNSILAAVINGALLSSAAAAILWAVLKLAPRRVLNAATRYVAWWAALILTAVAPALFLAATSEPAQRAVASQSAIRYAAPQMDGQAVPDALPAFPAATVMHQSKPAAPSRLALPRFPIELRPGPWARWLNFVWLLASAAMLARLAAGWISLYGTRTRATDAGSADRWLGQCRSRRHGIRLASTRELAVPAAVGPWRPAILFPERLIGAMDEGALEQIGLHEAAHLARYDDYTLAAQRILEALLALHPVARWIGRKIDMEREIACDDFVLAATGQSRSYASCLARMAELAGGARPSPVVAAVIGRSQLFHRVETLLDRTRNVGTALLWRRLSGVIAALALLAWIGARTPGVRALASSAGAAVHVPQLVAALAQAQIVTPSAAPQPQPPPPNVKPGDLCTIEGTVTNAATGAPLAKAFISAPTPYSAVTDEKGHYEMKGLPPGQYSLRASGAGSVSVLSPTNLPLSTSVTVAPGQRATGIDFKLMPASSVTGRVVNRDGDPVPGNYVTVAQYLYSGGVRELTDVASGQCNDLGEYRISGFPPGRYVLRVWVYNPSGQREVDRSAKPRLEDYVTSYYPGGTDPAVAAPVEFAPGQALAGLNITMLKTRVSRVTGRVDNQAGGDARSIQVTLQPASTPSRQLEAAVGPHGEFEFHSVPPGAYTLIALVRLPPNAVASAHQTVAVGSEPVGNQVITVKPPVDITGSVRVENDGKLDFRSMALELSLPWRTLGNFRGSGRIEENGAFRIPNINPERYALSFRSMPGLPNFYVKSARFGQADALTEGIDVPAGAAARLDIVLSLAAASVSGSVKDADGRAVAEAAVALVPQDGARQKWPMFYASAKTDQSGAFRLTGLAPGEYKLYAFAHVDGGPWTSPEFLKAFERQAQKVTLGESGQQWADLRVIPAEP